jgi:sulfite exporter TauE/SafE
MNGSLVAAGLLMGLASTPHCALMCSAPCAAIARRCGGPNSTQALLSWHAGRAVAYIVAGTIAATAVGLVARLSAGSGLMRPLWTLMQAAVLVLGLALLATGRMPHWVNAASQRLAGTVPVSGPHARLPSQGSTRAALFGLGWIAMPCAVLYGALAVAALAAGPLEGAAVMTAFSVGSAPGLAGVPFLWSRLARMPQTAALRIAGAMLAAGSLWALWHGLEGASGAWCQTH